MQLKFKHLWVMGTLLLTGSVLYMGCTKDAGGNDNNNIPAGKANISVYLSDAPVNYQNVLIDIRQVAVKIDTCQHNGDPDHNQPGCDHDHDQHNSNCEIWDTLNLTPGVYDLLTFRNGLDTIIANGITFNGKIERIQFVLGTNNSVVVDSVSHPLNLFNNQNYFYINIGRDHIDSITSNNFQLHLDFDLAHSIQLINGQYWLRPQMNPFSVHHTGEISGKITPRHSFGFVKAYNQTDSAFALPFFDGDFKIRSLPQGTYSVLIKGINGYSDSLINNIVVTRHSNTHLGNILLHQ